MTTIFAKDALTADLKLAVTTKFFRALGDPARLKILDSLMESEKNVSELVGLVGLSQGRVSSHLACLKQCGFVNTRRDGKLSLKPRGHLQGKLDGVQAGLLLDRHHERRLPDTSIMC